MPLMLIRAVFLVAGIFDIAAGLLFFLAYEPIYATLGIELPNNPGYVQLPALYVAIFGTGLYAVFLHPQRNHRFILLAILAKLGFAAVVLAHWAFGEMPGVYVPFAAFEVVFVALFAPAYLTLRRAEAAMPLTKR